MFLEFSSLNGVSSGNICLNGGPETIVEFTNASTTPTCVTDCNGCSELSNISGTCNDGSVAFTYAQLNSIPEICGNTTDDNFDGRIDEPYPGGVQTDLQLWLRAETGTNTNADGNDVTSWADQSANLYSANADVNATDWPTFTETAINFNPGINFDGTFNDGFSDGLHLGLSLIHI